MRLVYGRYEPEREWHPGTYLAPTAYLPMNPCTEAPSVLSAETRTMLFWYLHDNPPEHYTVRHESPFRLCCPARLIYPDYTDLRKRARERKR